MYRCLGSALCSSGTMLGKDWCSRGRAGRSLAYFWENSTQSVTGSAVLGAVLEAVWHTTPLEY